MTELSPTTETYRINPTIYRGRPENPQGRLPKELAAYDLLDSLGIPYERLDHDPLPTIEACQEVDRIFGLDICKNLFLRNAQKTSFYLLMMPGSKKFRTAALSKQIGSARLSFAEPEFMDVRLLIDRDVLENHPYIGCHPCINTSSLKLPTASLLEKFLPAVHHPYTLVELP